MKKVMFYTVGLVLAQTSFAALPPQCTTITGPSSLVQRSPGKYDTVYLYGNTARDLFSQLPSQETRESVDGHDFFSVSKNGIDCSRQQDLKETVAGVDVNCANYQCNMLVVNINL